jgi:hypothetical protein
MTVINLEDHKIYFEGSAFNPCFDLLVSFDTETKYLTLKAVSGETKTMRFVLDVNHFVWYSKELDTLEDLVKYFYSIGMKHNLERIPTELENKLENKDSMYKDLLGTLKSINDGVRQVSYKKPVVGADTDGDLEHIEDEELEGMCCEVLMLSGGRINWTYVKKLKDEGFNVFPTDQDSFGWLGAAVRTNKGLIFFG